jgi:hypothetical protein
MSESHRSNAPNQKLRLTFGLSNKTFKRASYELPQLVFYHGGLIAISLIAFRLILRAKNRRAIDSRRKAKENIPQITPLS